MKSKFLLFLLTIYSAFYCFADVPIENSETGASIIFPTDDIVSLQASDGRVTYSAGGGVVRRIARYDGNEVTYSPAYSLTIDWTHTGQSDDEIFREFKNELTQTTLHDYYTYSYGQVVDFNNSEKLLAENEDAIYRIHLTLIVQDGIIYQLQTLERVNQHSFGETIYGVRGDHYRFLDSFHLKKK